MLGNGRTQHTHTHTQHNTLTTHTHTHTHVQPGDQFYAGDFEAPAAMDETFGADVTMGLDDMPEPEQQQEHEQPEGEEERAQGQAETDGDAQPRGDADALYTGEDEEVVTSEQFAESGWTRRSKQVLSSFQGQLKKQDTLSFNTVTRGFNRKEAAQMLHEVLVLKTRGFIEVHQEEPFADIVISDADDADDEADGDEEEEERAVEQTSS